MYIYDMHVERELSKHAPKLNETLKIKLEFKLQIYIKNQYSSENCFLRFPHRKNTLY